MRRSPISNDVSGPSDRRRCALLRDDRPDEGRDASDPDRTTRRSKSAICGNRGHRRVPGPQNRRIRAAKTAEFVTASGRRASPGRRPAPRVYPRRGQTDQRYSAGRDVATPVDVHDAGIGASGRDVFVAKTREPARNSSTWYPEALATGAHANFDRAAEVALGLLDCGGLRCLSASWLVADSRSLPGAAGSRPAGVVSTGASAVASGCSSATDSPAAGDRIAVERAVEPRGRRSRAPRTRRRPRRGYAGGAARARAPARPPAFARAEAREALRCDLCLVAGCGLRRRERLTCACPCAAASASPPAAVAGRGARQARRAARRAGRAPAARSGGSLRRGRRSGAGPATMRDGRNGSVSRSRARVARSRIHERELGTEHVVRRHGRDHAVRCPHEVLIGSPCRWLYVVDTRQSGIPYQRGVRSAPIIRDSLAGLFDRITTLCSL